MHSYEEGDRVAIVLDGSQQMGMPHRRFHGRTGFIQKRQGVAWVVSVKDGNMQKTVIARPEHLRPAGVCRDQGPRNGLRVDQGQLQVHRW